MPARTSHPGVTVAKRRDGRFQLEWLPISATRRACKVLDIRNRRDAIREAEGLSTALAEERRRYQQLVAEGTDQLAARYRIDACLDEWIERPNTKASTQRTSKADTANFRDYCAANGLTYLDEITFGFLSEFRTHLASHQGLAAYTKNKRLRRPGEFLEWCKGKVRLAVNPMHIGKIEGFYDKRRRSNDDRWISASDRAALNDACTSTQERLMVALTMLVGLRNAEATHLKWGHWHQHVTPQELDVTYTVPDEIDPEGWDPKNGLRVVPLVWPEVVELLELWRSETAFGREDDDPILADPKTGRRYRQLPVALYRRLQRATGVKFTWQIGRRVACALAVIHAGRLTGREWTQKEHEQVFGHSGQTATAYYFDALLPRRRREESDFLTSIDSSPSVSVSRAGAGFSTALAKLLLKHLMDSSGTSRLALSRNECLPSDVAIGKWLREGKSVAPWFWDAVKFFIHGDHHPSLVEPGARTESASRSLRKQTGKYKKG